MNLGRLLGREGIPRERKGGLTGSGRRFSPKLLQKGAFGLRCTLKAFARHLLFLGFVRLLLNRESVLNAGKCRQEERRLLQRLRGLFRFVPLLQTVGVKFITWRTAFLVTHLDDL